jgi:hypothetical protein
VQKESVRKQNLKTTGKENTFNLSGIYHIKKKVMGYNARKLKVSILLDV